MEESIPSVSLLCLFHMTYEHRENITDHLINTLETEVEGKIVSSFYLFFFFVGFKAKKIFIFKCPAFSFFFFFFLVVCFNIEIL